MAPIRVAAVGDIMCGETFYQYRQGPRTRIQRLGAQFLDERIVSFLRSHDFVLGNVECVLSDQGNRPGSLRAHHMRGRPQTARLLKEWGFTCANVANNHILEQGRPAAIDTVQQLHAAGLSVIGAGRGGSFEPGIEAFESVVGGLRVGAVGGCLLAEKYAFDGGGSLDDLAHQTRGLAQRCDVVIVSLHWGTEYMECPSAGQRRIARAFADAGATLLVGHHPHVVQGVESVNGALVAYSLGNFIFGQPLEDTRWSVILSCEVRGREVKCWECMPVVLDDEERPALPRTEVHGQLLSELDRRHRLLASASALSDAAEAADRQAYSREAARRRAGARKRQLVHAIRRVPQLPISYTAQILGRAVLRRIGRW